MVIAAIIGIYDKMNYTILVAVIGLFQAVSVAVIGGLFARDAKKRRKDHEHTENRLKLRAKESLLSMKLSSANTNLTIVMARAIRDGKTNGEMEQALIGAEKAQHEYYDFINDIASKHMSAD